MRGKRRITDYTEITLLVIGLLLIICVISGSTRIKAYVVQSGSMEPAIRTGSLCFVDTKVPFGAIKEQDIIAFEQAGGVLVTHRVIGRSEGRLETKGDANHVSDGYTTTAGNYRGRVCFSIPFIGYAVRFFQTPVGLSVIVGVTVSVIYFNHLKRKQFRKENSKG